MKGGGLVRGYEMARDYSKGKYITIISKESFEKIMNISPKPYDAKKEAKKARKELRKQGLRV